MMMTKKVLLNILNDTDKPQMLTKAFGRIINIGCCIELTDTKEDHYIDFEYEKDDGLSVEK